MSPFIKRYLFSVGVVAAAGALLHIAIAFGGPEWYAFFGAPRGMVAMARAGNLRASVSCMVVAAILVVFAAYAFSGAGAIRRLPFTIVGLASIGGVLIVRRVVRAAGPVAPGCPFRCLRLPRCECIHRQHLNPVPGDGHRLRAGRMGPSQEASRPACRLTPAIG